jgi:neutral amino acid transport system permease protein
MSRVTRRQHHRPRHRILLLLALGLAVGAVHLLQGTSVRAQEPEEPEDQEEIDEEGDVAELTGGVRGTLRADREPVEGVVIRAFDADGDEVAAVETNEDGQWAIPLPEGTYTIVLDEEALPEEVTLAEEATPEAEQEVTQDRVAGVGFRLEGDGDGRAARTLGDRIAQAAVNGLKFGLIIAMAAVGLSLIFGTTQLINFAHGELVTFGAVVAWFLNTSGINIWGLNISGTLPIAAAVLLAMLIGAGAGGVLERGLFRPLRLRGTGLFQAFIITIALALALRQLLLVWFGEQPRQFALPLQQALNIGPVAITPRDLIVMGISLATLLTVGVLLQFTRVGRAVRAVADNQDLAASSGIDVQRVILYVWLFGVGLAALGGSLLGIVTTVSHLMGFELLLLMFAAVILGGLGTAFGAAAGGIVIGLATEITTVWTPAEIKFVWALAALVLVLLIRPQGIFGVRERVA